MVKDLRAYSLSSPVRNCADATSAGRTDTAIIARRIVIKPSRICYLESCISQVKGGAYENPSPTCQPGYAIHMDYRRRK